MSEHLESHDPIDQLLPGTPRCYVCYAAVSSAWARLTGLPIDTMEETIQRMAVVARTIANGLRVVE
jgi:hypothetical protein